MSSSILSFLESLSNELDTTDSSAFTNKNHFNKTNDLLRENQKSACDDLESESCQGAEIILSVYWKRGKLGASYYATENSELYILNDVVDVHPDFVNLKTLVHQVQPSKVVTCGGLSESFVQSLVEAVNGEENDFDENAEETSYKIFFMSTRKKDLGYDSCKRYILTLKLGFEPETLNEEDHVLFVNSHIDLAQESMVVSLGMLIKYLERYLQETNLNHEIVQIMFLNHISLENLLSMDENTFKALQIFNTRVHPSAFKRSPSGSNREGFSLFGIFNRCKSRIGMKKMRQIFLSPMKDLDEINNRLDTVEFCVKPQHQHIVQSLVNCIKKIENISAIAASIYRTRANISHWKSLYVSLYNTVLIKEICQKHSSKSKLLERVAKSITPNIYEMAHYINRVIDFEESTRRNCFTVQNGVDRKLDLLRQTYAEIPEVLIKVAELELEDLPSFISQCSIIYITELGYLLSVPIWTGDGTDAADYSLPGFEVKFIVNNYVHYKTPRCSELDNILGDSIASISTLESNIMISLIQFIHIKIPDMIKAVQLIAELDCLISLAVIACENNYRRPNLTKEKKLEIIQGRHPLQELCVDNFVPNDTKFESEDGLIKILTGPNASGKSVYLKQVALIAYLAHIGSFVPAQKAEIGVLDRISSRVQSVESISTRISAFLIDVKQMSLSLYNSTPRSLIIIDEFGKGTTEIDGLSLFAATLEHFAERKENCPFILATTHFHRLPQLLPSTSLIQFQYMNYLIENDEIIYLHKIQEGTCGSSLTHLAAKTAGLSEDALKRSLKVLESSGPIKLNTKLKVTRNMLKEIMKMKKIFDLTN